MKRLLVVCGGIHQIPLIKKAKELGYEVVNSNLFEDSPSFKYADYTEVIDILNYEKNLECAEKYAVDGVVAEQNELSIYTVAYVSEKMNLPTITTEMAELFTDKFLMREFCKKNGFPYPKYTECKTAEEAVCFFKLIGNKMIMKPLNSYSSKGVHEINTVEECLKYHPITSSFSRNKKGVILEEYIDGTEFTLDGIIINKKHYTLAISQKLHYSFNKNIASQLYFSYDNENYNYGLLRNMHNELIEKSGIQMGLTHSEYKYSNGKFYLIEMAARGGGNYIASKIVPLISGVDNYKFYIQSALQDCAGDADSEIISCIEKNKNKVAILYFFDFDTKGKKVKCIRGLDKIKKMQGVIDINLVFKKGDIVGKAYDDGSRPGYVIVIGESKEEIEKQIENINKTLEIEVE